MQMARLNKSLLHIQASKPSFLGKLKIPRLSSYSFLTFKLYQKLDEYPRKNWGICTGLSMNILHVGDKSPAQRGFFKKSAGNLLPALRFLGGLCNFCNYIFFNDNGIQKSDIFYRFENYRILPKSVWLKQQVYEN